jgi:hypothetical protein
MSCHKRSLQTRVLLAIGALAALLTFSACKGEQQQTGGADLTVRSLGALSVSSVVATVSGPGLPAPRSLSLSARGGANTWGGVIGSLPVGSNYVFTVSAFGQSDSPDYSGVASGIVIAKDQVATVIITAQQTAVSVPFRNAVPVIDSLVVSSTNIVPGASITAKATAHDPDGGDTITFAWSAGPAAGSFSTSSAATTTWTAPTSEGDETLVLAVTDNHGDSASASIVVHVSASNGRGQADVNVTFNAWPAVTDLVAAPGYILLGSPTSLTATASDADGDALSYAWTSTCASAVFSSATAAVTNVTLPIGATDASCDFTVTVGDGKGGSTTGQTTLPVGKPVAIEAPTITSSVQSVTVVSAGSSVNFSIAASDPQGSPLAFRWVSLAGSLSDQVDGAGSSQVMWTAPASATTTFTVSAIVTDALGASVQFDFTVASGPAFYLQASPTVISPGQQPEIQVIPYGNMPSTWTYAWDDGFTGSQAGRFAAKLGSDNSTVLYTPAYCPLLGSGAISIALKVTITDGATSLSRSSSVPITLTCPTLANLTTETLYQPQQNASTYEPAPAGFSPVYTELVARHGARGMSSEGSDVAVYNMWLKAQADGALTLLGQQLGPDVLAFIKANTVLGAGVSGISAPGYGNLTHLGAVEHQQLATRLAQRIPGYFAQVAANGRQLVVQTSGVNRAYDSSGFFVNSLSASNPALKPLITYSAAVAGYGTKPKAQLPGTNRFLLYFHKLSAAQDQVTNQSDSNYPTYQASLAYQTFKTSDPIQTAKVNAINAIPDVNSAAQIVLQGLFTQDFISKLGTTGYSFADTGSFGPYAGLDGKSYTTTGSGGTTINNALDAANNLYGIYIIAPAMQAELGNVDFTKYIPDAQATVLAYLGDATDFYQMGPGATENGNATYAMAQGLLNDFFTEVDAIAKGILTNGAKLRFTHAEIMVPFTSILGLKSVFVQLPKAETYTYAANSPWNGALVAPIPSPWRDEIVAPMAANVQWDVYSDGGSGFVVKMMLNEQETDFRAACDGARHAPGSHYYDYSQLKTCYQHVAQ